MQVVDTQIYFLNADTGKTNGILFRPVRVGDYLLTADATQLLAEVRDSQYDALGGIEVIEVKTGKIIHFLDPKKVPDVLTEKK